MKKTNLLLIHIFLISICVSINAQTEIKDLDGNTSVQTTVPSDAILFKLGGTNVFRMSNRTLEVFNTGNSVFIGAGAGANDDLNTRNNVALGTNALATNVAGFNNFALGTAALQLNTGNNNVAVGIRSMQNTTSGEGNVSLGSTSGLRNTTGANNVFIGYQAGLNQQVGDRNTLVGYQAGRGASFHNKTGNVCIGSQAGYNSNSDNKLYIDNSDTSDPLLYGDFATDQVGIGTSEVATGYALSVNGKIISEEVRVLLKGSNTAIWPDYVFLPEYNLKSLEEVDSFIKENGHLPNIPSAKEVEKEGIALGGMNKNLLEKIEELTLYMIDMNKDVKKLKAENESLKKEIESLKK